MIIKTTVRGRPFTINTKTKEGKDLYAALQLVERFGMSSIPRNKLTSEAIKALEAQEALEGTVKHYYNPSFKAAVDLASKYDTELSHTIAFLAYNSLPASYRPKAIIELKKMLQYQTVAFDIYYLGLLESKEGNQEEALELILTARDMNPSEPLYTRWAAEVLVKQNKLDDALDLLYKYRDSQYYLFFGKQMIDSTISDIEAKKARGYVYRPRKNN